MSKPYEDLVDSEKLKGLMHLPSKTGPILTRLLEVIQTYLDDLAFNYLPMVKECMQIPNALGNDIDLLGELLDISRLSSEDDEDLRTRVMTTAETFETVTKDAILDLFHTLLGKEPYLTEPFVTTVFESGTPQVNHEGGKFSLLFEIPISVKSEHLRIDEGGDTITVSDPTIVPPEVDAVSTTTGITTTDTTIYAQDVSEFPDNGELIIDDEWIRYTSKQTSPAAFLTCTRGLYDTVPATHVTDTAITEGSIKVFVAGTNEQVFDYQSGTSQVIYLKNNPYPWDSYFDLNYRIRGSEEDVPPGTVKKEFDTVAELVGAISQLRAIGFDFKAAGVYADISVGLPFREWFQDSEETITITDDYGLGVEGIFFPEYILPVPTPDTMVFYESQWDSSSWDKGLWTRGYWNGSSFVHFGTKENYYVEITGE